MIKRLKRIFALALLFGASVVQGQDTMYIAQKVGGWLKLPVSNIDSVTFKKAKQTVDITIGKTYQGGIIAYIYQPGDPGYVAGQTHGLIAAPSNQSTGIIWYNGSYTVTGATGTALGTGASNTAQIVAVQGAGSYAAKICDDLVLGGYIDWFLPSKNELNKLYLNKTLIGGFVEDGYWSSSENYTSYAWVQDFGNGYQKYGYNKNSTYYVRAVRAF